MFVWICANENGRSLFQRHDIAGGAWLSNTAATNYMAVCRLYCWCTTHALTRRQVVAAKGCLATSTMSGHGLSVATAGIARSFTVTVRDSFGNLRPTGADFPLSSYITSDNLPGYAVNVAQPSANRFCLSVSCCLLWRRLPWRQRVFGQLHRAFLHRGLQVRPPSESPSVSSSCFLQDLC